MKFFYTFIWLTLFSAFLHAHHYEEFSYQVDPVVQTEIVNVIEETIQALAKLKDQDFTSHSSSTNEPFDIRLYEVIGLYDRKKYDILKKIILDSPLNTLLSPIPLHKFKTELEYMLDEYMYVYHSEQKSYLNQTVIERLEKLDETLNGSLL